jgi:hypothetical protein
MGRKNFLFANTPAELMTVRSYIALWKHQESGLDPYRYLVSVITTAPMLDLYDDSRWRGLLPEAAAVECKTMES